MAEQKLILHENPDQPVILTSDLKEILIDCPGVMELNMVVSEHTQAALFIRIRAAASLSLHVTAKAGSEAVLLYWNESDRELLITERNEVYHDAYFKAAYGHLSSGTVHHQGVTVLKEPGAQAFIQTAAIAKTSKSFVIDCLHEAPHTEGIIENYAIILKNGQYQMEATGKINKGARGAKSHQTSRALTFDAGQKATILPKLLIDENEVEASHATSIGQMDDNQMYYLQSRGLSEADAVKLVTIGYLLPIAKVSEDPEIQKALQQEIESKVNDLCLTS